MFKFSSYWMANRENESTWLTVAILWAINPQLSIAPASDDINDHLAHLIARWPHDNTAIATFAASIFWSLLKYGDSSSRASTWPRRYAYFVQKLHLHQVMMHIWVQCFDAAATRRLENSYFKCWSCSVWYHDWLLVIVDIVFSVAS